MARMRAVRTAAGDDGWQRTVLPHTQRSADHFERHHGGSGSLPIEPSQFLTKPVYHGETQHALQVMDSTDGWSEWSIHKQTGPDATDPDHWERLGCPTQVNPFCHCLGEDGEEADLDYPVGVEDGLAGYADGADGDWKGTGRAKREAEEAWRRYVEHQTALRDEALGAWDDDRRNPPSYDDYDYGGFGS